MRELALLFLCFFAKPSLPLLASDAPKSQNIKRFEYISRFYRRRHIMQLPHSTFSFVLYFVQGQWKKFLFLVLASVILAANEAVFPFFLKKIVDSLTGFEGGFGQVIYEVRYILIALISFWVIDEIALRTQGFMQVYTFPEFRKQIRERVF